MPKHFWQPKLVFYWENDGGGILTGVRTPIQAAGNEERA
jgi:hypothetical protein